jgi:hypothetical protein
MWQHYRKTFVVTQLFILLLCAGAYFFAHAPTPAVLFIFVMMEVSAVFGAAWAASLKRRVEARRTALPLMKGRR